MVRKNTLFKEVLQFMPRHEFQKRLLTKKTVNKKHLTNIRF